jgi:NAD(P)-dependent dehydrogenase (short-subunit alcohol dehydrogenase family)
MPTVLVTGANRGLGLEFVRQYAADGWRVLACSRGQSAELGRLAEAYPEICRHALDVTDHLMVEGLATTLSGEPIDVLLNNAGVYGAAGFTGGGMESQSFGHTDYADWFHTLEVNVLGPMKMSEAFVEHVAMSEQKKIITLSSIVGSMELNTSGGLYRYRSSKAAVNAIMKSMSLDLHPRGIMAVAVHPGWVRSDMGGPNAEIEAETSVAGVRKVIAALTKEQLGRVISYDGETLPY